MTASIDGSGILHVDFTKDELEVFTEKNIDTAMSCARDMLVERDKTNLAMATLYTNAQDRYATYMAGFPYSQKQTD